MALLRLNSICISFGDNPILQNLELAVDEHERIALVGRNGTGKSTLLKILSGSISADTGERVTRQGVKLAYLQQDVPDDISGSTYKVVASGLEETGKLLSDYHAELSRLSEEGASAEFNGEDRLSKLQSAIDDCNGWQVQQRVDETLSRMQLDPDMEFSQLSGGMKRRVLLARALLVDPDILLLDEPTNHLDIPAIQWIEQYLKTLRCSIIFITHDRSFLRSMANRIIDLDRGQLTDWPGNYEKFLTGKEEMLETEAQHNAAFDKKLAQEEVWIRQGIKARRTRNEGRVRALKKLRDQRRQRINVTGTANLNVNQASRSGKKVIECENISFGFNDKPIIRNFSTNIVRGDKIGVIGPNGAGKSTLIKLLLGELTPTSGTLKLGTNLEVSYFDQLRSSLDLKATAMDNVSGGRDMVTINDEQKHIISYMQDFLFEPARARAPITALSGGETNRLMLAKLFLRPSNLLVLDEPTNDLDIETLELLESLLADYPGTVIVISHDREFIDNIATSTIVFDGSANIEEFVGGYTDWIHQSGGADGKSTSGRSGNGKKPATNTASDNAEATPKPKPAKLSYKLQRELEGLPNLIDSLEAEVEQLQQTMSEPGFYGSSTDTAAILARAEAAAAELESAYSRWDELETLRSGDAPQA